MMTKLLELLPNSLEDTLFMPVTAELILTDLVRETRKLSEGLAVLEATTRAAHLTVETSVKEIKGSISRMSEIQLDHAQRITLSEVHIAKFHGVDLNISKLAGDIALLGEKHIGLRKQVEDRTPVRTPWTAVATAIVALAALAWSLLGR
jgi:hypothetical protein